jgi:trehalose 6-phosphate synthase
VAGALGEADRLAAADGTVEAEGFNVDLLAIEDAAYRAYYDVIANGTLWFVHHGLWDIPRRPRFDRHWWEAWERFEEVNRAFAARVAECAPHEALVLVQDYHLALVAPTLRALRPDVATVHFSHTPFASPEGFRVLPTVVAQTLLRGMTANVSCGFHSDRWASAYAGCCEEVLGFTPETFVAPAAADAGDVRAVAASDACALAHHELDGLVGDRHLIVRVDRIELSKNIVRGFLAFEELLETEPRWRGDVIFGAFVYPSREGLAEYQAYRQEVEAVIERINLRWGTPDWTPILYDPKDDFARSVAALRRADVLLVNPVRDGLNLVAKEGPIVNERDAVLALSRESGVWDELGEAALGLHPFDITGTAAVLDQALSMGTVERARRAAHLRALASARTPIDWLADLVAAAGRGRE